jgi:hypothetical protein
MATVAGYPVIWSIRYSAGYPAIKSGIWPTTGSLKRADYPANRISGASLLRLAAIKL